MSHKIFEKNNVECNYEKNQSDQVQDKSINRDKAKTKQSLGPRWWLV